MKTLAKQILSEKEKVNPGYAFDIRISYHEMEHYKSLHAIPEFIKEVRISGMKSVALEMGGHRPETDFELCPDKINNWSKENGIVFYDNIRERYFNFRYKRPNKKIMEYPGI